MWMHARPVRLNAAIAWLFMVGSTCFALGSVPAYVDAVGASTDAITYFVGSIFFTSASYLQLLQSQSPAMTGVDERGQHERRSVVGRAWLKHDRNWLAAVTQFPGTLFFNISTFGALAHNLSVKEENQNVWRPDFFGSTLFLVASAFAIMALGGRFLSWQPRSLPWWIAWLNMLGSIAFGFSAIASYVLPTTGELINSQWSIGGTFVGAVCFLIGAALMLPAWRSAVSSARSAEPASGQTKPE
jgi:hypothetical protein